MDKFKNYFNKYILDSPGCKTFFAFVLPILSGIFTGIFITEITTSTGIDWELAKEAKSTYALIFLIIVIYKYNE